MFKNSGFAKTHRIQVFGVSLLLVLSIMLADVIAIHVYAAKEDAAVYDTRTIYSRNVVTSLSGVQGQIVSVYASPGRTKVAVALKFANPEMMPSDAAEYSIGVRGFNTKTQKYALDTYAKTMKGGYYIFGQTGYSVVYFVNSEPFPSQTTEVIVRTENTLNLGSSKQADELKARGGTYAKYDQYRFVINLGASDMPVAAFMDNFKPETIYQYSVVDEKEAAIREQLNNDVVGLNTLRRRINEYAKTLSNLNVITPGVPNEMVGDEFTNPNIDSKGNPLYGDYQTNSKHDPNLLVYTPTKYIFPGGVDFNWFTTDLHEVSYLKSLAGTTPFAEFFKMLQSSAASGNNKKIEWPANFNTTIVMKTDGSKIQLSDNTGMGDIPGIQKAANNYINAVNQYYELKRQYQTQDLVDYLKLDYEVSSTGGTYTANFNDKSLVVWGD